MVFDISCRRALVATLAAAWLALSPAAIAEEPQTSFSESIEVNLVNVQVIVTTFSGRPITSLTRDDFRVWEDGEPREITHFAQVLEGAPEPALRLSSPGEPQPADVAHAEDPATAAGAAVAAGRSLPGIVPTTVFDRTLVMAFDAGIDRPYLKRAVSHSRRFVVEHAEDGIFWSVVLLGRRPFNLVPLTSDSDHVVAALDGLLENLRGVQRTRTRSEDFAAISEEVWRTPAQPRRPTLEGQWCRLPLTEHTLAPSYLAQSLSQVFRAYASVPGVKACVVYQLGAGGSRVVNAQAFLLAGGLVNEWRNLGRLASSAGFTVYAMDVTGLDHPLVAGSGSHGSYSNALLHSVPTTAAADFGPSALAKATGGELVQSNDLGRALQIAAQGTETYYTLAFAAPRSHDDRPHHVKVEVDIPGHPFARVRYSTGFIDVDPRTLLVENLATPADFPKVGGVIPLGLEMKINGRDEEQVDFTAIARVPSDQLAFVPQDEGSIAEVDVFVAVHDGSGALVHIKQDRRRLSANRDVLDVELPFRMLLPDAPYQITVALYDTVSGLSGMSTLALSPSAASG